MNFAIHSKLLNRAQRSMDGIMETLKKIPYDPPGDPWAEVQRHKGRAAAYLDAAHTYREENEKMLVNDNVINKLQTRMDKAQEAMEAEQAEEEPNAEEIAYLDGEITAYYWAIKYIKDAEHTAEEG